MLNAGPVHGLEKTHHVWCVFSKPCTKLTLHCNHRCGHLKTEHTESLFLYIFFFRSNVLILPLLGLCHPSGHTTLSHLNPPPPLQLRPSIYDNCRCHFIIRSTMFLQLVLLPSSGESTQLCVLAPVQG